MLEIIPNWHPIIVHFSVALLVLATLLQLGVLLVGDAALKSQWQTVARWNLWIGAGFVVLTVLSGIVAYNTVAHDTPSHLAMTEHRNWALVTAAVFLALAAWSMLRSRAGLEANSALTAGLVVGAMLLVSTAWHGGELVYRYGLGVMSLPKAESHDHVGGASHEHGDAHSESHGHDTAMPENTNNDEHEADSPHTSAHTQDTHTQDTHTHETTVVPQPATTTHDDAHTHDDEHSHDATPHEH